MCRLIETNKTVLSSCTAIFLHKSLLQQRCFKYSSNTDIWEEIQKRARDGSSRRRAFESRCSRLRKQTHMHTFRVGRQLVCCGSFRGAAVPCGGGWGGDQVIYNDRLAVSRDVLLGYILRVFTPTFSLHTGSLRVVIYVSLSQPNSLSLSLL